jgi:RNA polymerase sigma factor (sigma-70 family)
VSRGGQAGTQPVPAFQVFLDSHRATVYRFLVAAVGSQDADDAFQETFMAALRGYRRLTDGSNLDRWILTIASRKAIDHHRATGRRAIPSEHPPDGVTTDRDPHDAGDPLWTAVRALPPRQRVAVVHRHVLDRSYADIAELMDSSEQTARANVHQGMKRLRELME